MCSFDYSKTEANPGRTEIYELLKKSEWKTDRIVSFETEELKRSPV